MAKPRRTSFALLCSLLALACAACGAPDRARTDSTGEDPAASIRHADGGVTQPDGGGSSADAQVVAPRDASASGPDAAAVQPGAGVALVPARGALLGHFYGAGTLAATDARIGRTPAVHLTYFAWEDDWTQGEAPSADLAQGRVPLVNWEPAGVRFADIVSGALDTLIRARARGAKALQKPFFLDFAAEMNGDEGAEWTGNDASLYIAAWRHLHDVFVAEGASNVVWLWAPNVTDIDGGNQHTMDYYPGDAYVDWTGVDGYNWGSSKVGFRWQSFHAVFQDIYPLLAAKQKPIMIGEMASDEIGGDKAAWIDGIVPTLKSDFPWIRGFVWFDIAKERAWQIDSSPAALAAYRKLAADPYLDP